MANEELLNEEEISILSLTDEEGNEVEFELIDSVDFEGITVAKTDVTGKGVLMCEVSK